MDNTVKKGFSLFIGAVILLSLVYINVQPTRAASIIDGSSDAVWFDLNGNGIYNPGEGIDGIDVYLDNSGLIGATTAAGGSFSNVFLGVAPGSLLDWDGLHYLTFKAEGFLTVTYNVDNSSGALSLTAGSVQMILADSIYGRVTGTDGKPLAGIKVEVLNYVTHAVINDVLGVPATTRTDQFGNYVFSGISSGTYDIRASKEEYMDQVKNAVQVIRGETTENVNFTLYPNNGTVQGHVSNGGAPVQGAVVSIPGLGVSGVSDSNGDYVITGVMPGSYTVICEKDGYKICVQYYKDSGAYTLNPAPYSAFVQPGAAVTTLADFNLVPEYLTPTTGYVSGIVLDENMRPIEAATVEIPGLGLSVATDKMGYYMFVEVPNGEYDVVAIDACPNDDKLYHKTKKQRVDVVPNFNFIADFSLLENPGFIVGQIMDKDGLPVPNVPMSIPNSTISSLTDSSGWYVLEGVNIERYTVYDYTSQSISYHVAPVIVKAKEPHYYLKTLEVSPEPANESYSDTYDLVIIRKTGVIKGKVFALGSGAPIEGAKVRAYGRMAITNGSGIYEFVQVPIGSYTVVADDDVIVSPSTPYPDPYVEDDYDLVIKTGNVVSAGLQTNVDFYLPAATASYYGYVSGVVYEDVNISSALEEGEGIPGITVEVPGYPTAVSDDFGFYIVKADGGVHNLVAYGADYEWYPQVPPALYTFVGDTENPYQDIAMVKQNGELIGNISDRGDPVDEADVWTPGYGNDWAYDGTDVIGVLSDFYGNYVFASGNALPKGRHLVISQKFDHNSGDPYWYEFEFNFVNIESTITKNIALDIETGRVEGFVWDDLNGDGLFTSGEPAKPDAAVYLSKLYGATSDTTGYYTILDVPVTKDRTLTPVTPAEDPDIIYEINRYTGIAYLLGYNTETHESLPITADASIYLYGDIPLSAIDYEFCNNIEVMEDIELTDVTVDIDYPLDKADPLPVTGDVSGRVVLSINDINAEAEVWIQATTKNTWTDIEGFWIILNVPTPTPPSYYAIQAGKPHYVTDIIYNVPVPKAIETQNIDFTLEKDGAIEGFVFEDINHNDVWDYVENGSNTTYDPGVDDPIDVPISNAAIKIANMTVYTDSLGYYRLDGIYANAPYIPYTATCTKDGYSFVADYDVNVIHLSGVNGSGIPPEEVNFLLEKDEGLIIGRVSDSTTMAGIAGIDVAAL
ncbi:MAG: carboxypeptidase regulatory-like domain-containing protein, partial [Candidatus Methanofastidiosia archaeon]